MKSNQISKQKWEDILKACCNAESEVEHLQNIIEELNSEKIDLKESTEKYSNDNNKLKAELKDLNERVIVQFADYESRIYNFLNNQDHINKLILQSEVTIKDLETENQKLKTSQVNNEHLAKQLLKLSQEKDALNSKLNTLQCEYHKGCSGLLEYYRCGKCTCCKLKLANETNINLKENNNNL